MPAIIETDEGGSYVTKFRGAGQGARALVAEIIVGGIALRAGLPMPDIALVQLDESFGRTEKDPEIQDILQGSRGVNVGLRYLPGAFNFDPLAAPDVDGSLASGIVWLDALTTNIDRTPRNPNMLHWEGNVWLIDHGAALYFHHDWGSVDEAKMTAPFAPIRDHVLLPAADDIEGADSRLSKLVTPEAIDDVLAGVPDELLMDAPEGVDPPFPTPDENRQAYRRYFVRRLEEPRAFAATAVEARRARLSEPQIQQKSRR
jgi:hypothetical protein